jgi:hypothetical protein
MLILDLLICLVSTFFTAHGHQSEEYFILLMMLLPKPKKNEFEIQNIEDIG